LLLKRCLEMNNPQKLKTLSGGSWTFWRNLLLR
jgi:hypothetical protein